MYACNLPVALTLLAASFQGGCAGPSFLAVGDWGGDSDKEPTTKAQIKTAAGMAKVAKSLRVDSVFMLGDNFYNSGVKTCSSPRFDETFESVYGAQAALSNLQFHIIAGNHDHRGSVEAQLAYNGSARWHFPSEYYKLSKAWKTSSGESRSLDILFVDTVELVGNSDGEFAHRHGHELAGPEDKARADVQWTWLEQGLSSSTADFLWVAGHFPIYSAGDDGTTDLLVRQMLPLLKKYGAHYISGHDHMFEHLETEGVQMFLAGAGMECCYDDSHMDTVPDGVLKFLVSGDQGTGKSIGHRDFKGDIDGGFASLQFSDEDVQVSFHVQDGSILHSAAPVSMRSQALHGEQPSIVV
mmetsp:Transcript_83374/g.269785  ORF Transcript_83374/g.269785 Transcript_83374/m.269785 type:complete len:354 (-) Transcript_83374:680-1741(-)|eukprot:CAMPEP_0204167940 /NCGR_PEP_ID=MMETSP0361-20130328/40297_1 /ASSEMBLY_ACC=CAM_ASM_000343 /TAXON_ID=268821 /ORGANISM="Scrippsiella Hangoei, Strain SHTV-5" /LENGTH=353 /DNA_ID=CAMNT_0051125327 /DNA_START=35 /DNA_END=1096 /DNA_ORIENTATION=+